MTSRSERTFKPWRTYAPLKAQQHPPAPAPPRRYCDADDCPCADDGRCPACGNIGRLGPPDLLGRV